MTIIQKALQFATEKHGKTGKLYNGKPYIEHPILTYWIMTTVANGDENLLAATYLHDTLEDTDTTYEELVLEFNEDIASLVKEVTKNENKDFPNLKTSRGLILKVCDRLANVSELFNASEEKQVKLLKKYSFCFINEGSHLKRG